MGMKSIFENEYALCRTISREFQDFILSDSLVDRRAYNHLGLQAGTGITIKVVLQIY